MERTRLESAATDYTYLRGLFGIPIGLTFILAALGNVGWGPLDHAWVFLVCLAAIGLSCVPINHFYNRRYGRVTLSTRQQVRVAVATLASAALILGGSALLNSGAGFSLDLPVNPIAVTFALGMLLVGAATLGVKPHHVVVLGTLLAIGLLPVWSGPDTDNAGLALAGVAVMVMGLLDHRLLVRTFGRSVALTAESGDAGA